MCCSDGVVDVCRWCLLLMHACAEVLTLFDVACRMGLERSYPQIKGFIMSFIFSTQFVFDPIWRSGGQRMAFAYWIFLTCRLWDFLVVVALFLALCRKFHEISTVDVRPRQHGFVWGTRTPFCRFLSSSRGFRLVRWKICWERGWSMFVVRVILHPQNWLRKNTQTNTHAISVCSGCRTWEFDGWACGSRYAGFGFGSGAPSQRVLGAALCARNWVSCNGNRRPFHARFPAEAAAVLDPQQIPHAEDNPMGSFGHKHLYYIPLCNLLHDDILSLLQQKAELPVTKWTVFTSFPFLQLEFDAWYAWWPFRWFWMQVKLAYTFSDIPRQDPSIYGKLQLI